MAKRDAWCKHYNGIGNGPACDLGIRYTSVTVYHDPPLELPDGRRPKQSIPCIPTWNHSGTATCDRLEFRTAEEIAAEEAEHERKDNLLRQGLSWCCEVPIDKSHVITSGRHKGHGSRYCSKCGKLLFMV